MDTDIITGIRAAGQHVPISVIHASICSKRKKIYFSGIVFLSAAFRDVTLSVAFALAPDAPGPMLRLFLIVIVHLQVVEIPPIHHPPFCQWAVH